MLQLIDSVENAPWAATHKRESNHVKALHSTRKHLQDRFYGAPRTALMTEVEERLSRAMKHVKAAADEFMHMRLRLCPESERERVTVDSALRRLRAENDLINKALELVGVEEECPSATFGFHFNVSKITIGPKENQIVFLPPRFSSKDNARGRSEVKQPQQAKGSVRAKTSPPETSETPSGLSPKCVHALIIEDCDDYVEGCRSPDDGGFDFTDDPLFSESYMDMINAEIQSVPQFASMAPPAEREEAFFASSDIGALKRLLECQGF